MYSSETRDDYVKYCNDPDFDKVKCKVAMNDIYANMGKVNAYAIYDTCYGKAETGLKKTPFTKFKEFSKTAHKLNSFKSDKFINFEEKIPLTVGVSCSDDSGAEKYFNRKDVQEALNVRTDLGREFVICQDRFDYSPDGLGGSFWTYKTLLENKLRIFIYSEDTDTVVSYVGTEKWIKNLNLPTLEKYRSWNIGDPYNIGGYVVKYDGLTFLTVRGAGHMVPQFKPEAAEYMVNQFLNGEDL